MTLSTFKDFIVFHQTQRNCCYSCNKFIGFEQLQVFFLFIFRLIFNIYYLQNININIYVIYINININI